MDQHSVKIWFIGERSISFDLSDDDFIYWKDFFLQRMGKGCPFVIDFPNAKSIINPRHITHIAFDYEEQGEVSNADRTAAES